MISVFELHTVSIIGPGVVGVIHKPTGYTYIKHVASIKEAADDWRRKFNQPKKYRLPKLVRLHIDRFGTKGDIWFFEYVPRATEADAEQMKIQLETQGLSLNTRVGRPPTGTSPMALFLRLLRVTKMTKIAGLDEACIKTPLDNRVPLFRLELAEHAAAEHFAYLLHRICWEGKPRNNNPSPEVIAELWRLFVNDARHFPERPLPASPPRTLREVLDLPDWDAPAPWRGRKY